MSAPVVVRPRRLRLVVRIAAAGTLLTCVLLAVLLRRGTGAEHFGVGDQVGLVGIGVLLAGLTMLLDRARVVADEAGVRVRNVVGEQYLPWQVVRAVRLDEGASWAQLDLQDDETVGLLAVQTNDGAAAVDAVLALRRLLAASRET